MTSAAPDLDGLIDAARRTPRGDARWDVVAEASACAPRSLLAAIERLLADDEPRERELGVLLAAATMQPGGRAADGAPRFTAEDRALVGRRLRAELERSSDPALVQTALRTAGVLKLTALLDAVLARAGDPDPDVREACAWALGRLEALEPSAPVVSALVALAEDPVDEVRDWALSALGAPTPVDTEETRRVFRANASHRSDDVRYEAVLALGLLGDVDMLATAIERYDVSRDAVEAAERLADPRLYEPLLGLRERGWTETVDADVTAQLEELLDAALAACKP